MMLEVFLIGTMAIVSCLAEEPFSIGLGVLSPSYHQTVGHEKVKVKFNQKNDGFSYSIADPSTGSNSFLDFGSSQGLSAPGDSFSGPSALQEIPSPNLAEDSPSPFSGSSPFQSEQGLAAFGPSGSFGGHNGFGGFGGSSSFGAFSDGSFSGSPDIKKRDGDNAPKDMMPAGFSYHALEGQSYLNDEDESDAFVVYDPKKDRKERGQAEASFHRSSQGYNHELDSRSSRPGSLSIGQFSGERGTFQESAGH